VHVMETLNAGQNLEDAKVRSSIAQQVLPLIEDVPSSIERETYRQQLARLLRIDERALLGSQKVQGKARPRPARSAMPADRTARVVEVRGDQHSRQFEIHTLALLLSQPDRLYDLDRALKNAGLEKYSPNDYEDSENQLLAEMLIKALTQDALDPQEYIDDHCGEELEARLALVKSGIPLDEKNEEKILEDLYRTLINLRLSRCNVAMNQLRFLQDEDGETTEKDDLQALVLNNILLRGKLDRALAVPVVSR